MRNAYLDKAIELRRNNVAYASAQIVRRVAPSSGKPGDQAIITADGQIHGWIGGGCTRGIVLKEALLSLQDRKPRLVSISPNSQPNAAPGTKIYAMTCQSGGEVDVYIEPVLPKPQLLVFGTSHIGIALAKLAKAMDYRVEVIMSKVDKAVYADVDQYHELSSFTPTADYQNSFVIVCTQGEGDLQALLQAINLDSRYLAFVSSRKKAQSIFTDLRQHDINFDQLKKIKTPAGIDIGAKLPEEVAISILAEVVATFRESSNTIIDLPQAKSSSTSAGPTAPPKLDLKNDDFYINPVCQIPVQKSTAKYVLEYSGEKVYFCCDGCKVSFEKDPEKYMVEA